MWGQGLCLSCLREKVTWREMKRMQVCYRSELHGVVLLSFLSIVLDFVQDLSFGLGHQLPQRPVRCHRLHKGVLWRKKRGSVLQTCVSIANLDVILSESNSDQLYQTGEPELIIGALISSQADCIFPCRGSKTLLQGLLTWSGKTFHITPLYILSEDTFFSNLSLDIVSV